LNKDRIKIRVILEPSFLWNGYLLDLTQGAFQFVEVAGAKRLDARTVVAVKRRDGPRAASILGFLWAAEPQSKMEGVHWLELWVLLGVLVVLLKVVVSSPAKAAVAVRVATTNASITGTMMRLITHLLSQVRGLEAFSSILRSARTERQTS
jgi:hypothetical protein